MGIGNAVEAKNRMTRETKLSVHHVQETASRNDEGSSFHFHPAFDDAAEVRTELSTKHAIQRLDGKMSRQPEATSNLSPVSPKGQQLKKESDETIHDMLDLDTAYHCVVPKFDTLRTERPGIEEWAVSQRRRKRRVASP